MRCEVVPVRGDLTGARFGRGRVSHGDVDAARQGRLVERTGLRRKRAAASVTARALGVARLQLASRSERVLPVLQ